MQVCNMRAKVAISVSVPQVPNSRRLNVLFCTGVTRWVIINKFHVIKNDPTNIHVLEFGPSYDVRNGVEKAVLIACGSGGPNGTLGLPRVTLFGIRN